jgi:hypothetical protein
MKEELRNKIIEIHHTWTKENVKAFLLDHDFEKANRSEVLADRIIEILPHWISVGERLPEDKQVVDVWIKHDKLEQFKDGYRATDFTFDRREGRFYGQGRSYWIAKQPNNLTIVVYWQPLPKPPEEKK